MKGVPGELKSAAEIVQTQVNNTAGFVKYMESTLRGIVGNVTAQLEALTAIDKKKPINLKGVFDRLVQVVHNKTTSDPLCIDAQVYDGAKIPTQCVGPVFDLLLDGGSCVEDLVTGVVTCTQPSVTLTKTPGACNLKYTSPTVVQDRYCATSTTYGNSSSGTFKHPAEIFNLEKLLTVPNPFNLDLSFYTATASASASPVAKPPKPGLPPIPAFALPPKFAKPPEPAPAPVPAPMMAPAPGPAVPPMPADMGTPFSAQNARAAPGVEEQPYMHEAAQKTAADEAQTAAAAQRAYQVQIAAQDAQQNALSMQGGFSIALPPTPAQAPAVALAPGAADPPAFSHLMSQLVSTGMGPQTSG